MEGLHYLKKDTIKSHRVENRGRPPEKLSSLFNTNDDPARFKKEFSPPEINWREALNRMNREVHKIYNLPPVENLLEKTPTVVKASLEIRQKYFNKRNEDIIKKARSIFDSTKIEKHRKQRELKYADIIPIDNAKMFDQRCEEIELNDIRKESVSVAIMEEVLLHEIKILDQKCLKENLCSKTTNASFFLQTKDVKNKKYPSIKSKCENESLDWRTEFKNRNLNKKLNLENVKLGVPEYKPPFKSSIAMTDWRDVLKSKIENSEDDNPFLKWNKMDQFNNNSKTNTKSIKMKPPKQRDHQSNDSKCPNGCIFGPKIKLRQPNQDHSSNKPKLKKKTFKIINFVAISVMEEDDDSIKGVKKEVLKEANEVQTNASTPPRNNIEPPNSQIKSDENPISKTYITNKEKHQTMKASESKEKEQIEANRLPFELIPVPDLKNLVDIDIRQKIKRKISIEEPKRQFKFSEDKRNFVVDNYFLGNVYIGPQKSSLNKI